jgi:hypothetical protein
MNSVHDDDAIVTRERGCLKAVLRETDAALPGDFAALHASLDQLSRSPRIAEAEQLLAGDAERHLARKGKSHA